MATNTWTPAETIYADKAGKIVSATDPTRTRVLAQAGQPMLREKAERLGLIDAEGNVVAQPATATNEDGSEPAPDDAAAKDKNSAPATKDIKGPAGRKSS